MTTPGDTATKTHPDSARDGVLSWSFGGLLVTQFLGALNDNMFRWLVIPIGMLAFGEARALMLGTVLFTAPYLVLANFAGFLADRFDKRRVIVWCKVAEIVLMVLGIVGIATGSVWFLFVVVMLMGSQSALFGPAKFGSIPEMVRADRISAANGVMGLITVTSAALGTFAGLALYEGNRAAIIECLKGTGVSGWEGLGKLWPLLAAYVGTAAVGWAASLLIRPLAAADPSRRLSKNPVRETYRDLRFLVSKTALLRAALGIAFFWMLASLAQSNITLFGKYVFGLGQTGVGVMLVVLVVGMAAGSVSAGLLSRGRVELGLVPLGVGVIIGSSVLLCLVGTHVPTPELAEAALLDIRDVADSAAFWWCCAFLFTLGMGAGFFNVPLESFLQHKSESQTRGTVLAAANFLAFSMMIVSSCLFYLMREVMKLSSSQIFLMAGLLSVPVLLYVVWLLPYATVRFAVWLVSLVFYRLKVVGRENIPEQGGALLVCNHVSRLDGPLLLLACPRAVRIIADVDFFKGRILKWMAKVYNVINLHAAMGPKEIVRALKTAREAAENGELVCIFPEGELTKTGQLGEFQRGMMRIIEGSTIPVIPVNLGGLWGSIFSYSEGKLFWKRPTTWPYPVTVRFGKPLTGPESVYEIRQAVEHLGVETVENQPLKQLVPPRRFLRRCRRNLSRVKIADSSGAELTGGKLLAGSLVMKRLLHRHVFSPGEQMVGVLLPPTVAGAVINAAIALSRKVAVNLNYTLSEKDINHCIRAAGIKHIITSRKFMERLSFKLEAEPIYAEDLKEKVTKTDQAVAAAQAYGMPTFLLERLHGLTKIRPDDVLGIIFTSGSTGEPKGVMLSQNNVMSNIESTDALFHWKSTDSIMGIMPFFHSFGFTLSLWMTLTTEIRAVFHFNPIDARTVGKLCEAHKVSILMGTPTFLRAYLKRCTPEQMAHLELAVVGAEKLPRELADEFQKKFGVLPTEGYGATELSPLAAANVPKSRTGADKEDGLKFGTVGRAIPGTSVRVVDPDTGEELGPSAPGILQFSGPNVMLGYLNQPQKTAEVIKDGWYHTGDIGTIDEAGFITLTGRLNRFSKIGGEMVPHVKIEEQLREIVKGDFPEDENLEAALAVTSVPDEKKGEKLVVLHKPLPRSVDEILKKFDEQNLPNLWRPAGLFRASGVRPHPGDGQAGFKRHQRNRPREVRPPKSPEPEELINAAKKRAAHEVCGSSDSRLLRARLFLKTAGRVCLRAVGHEKKSRTARAPRLLTTTLRASSSRADCRTTRSKTRQRSRLRAKTPTQAGTPNNQ